MTAQEIGEALISGEANLIISACLILGLWLARRIKAIEKLSTKQELIAVSSAVLGVVGAQLLIGAEPRKIAVQAFAVLLTSLKYNSKEIPVRKKPPESSPK